MELEEGGAERVSWTKGKEGEIWRASAIARRKAGVFAYVVESKKGSGENDMGKNPYWRNLVNAVKDYSKAYSTATEQASLDCASRPC